MQLKKVTQKNSDGSSISYEFSVPPKQEIPHPGNPKGTDTVPAWLTPGEFVMNAEATRMYKPQIEAMNEQGKAVQRQQGGSIPSYHAKGGEAGPCWDGYEMVGMKDKGGKQVPNCVPQYKKEGGFIDWLSSLLGMESVPEKAVQAPQEPQMPANMIPSDYNVRPLDLPPESPMVQPQAAVPTPATPNSYLDAMTQAESSGRADAKNPNSSATGLHQFTAPTWLAVAKKYEPDLANSMSEEELLALRTDPATSTRMANHLTNENKRILERKDIATTNDNLYLLHFGGPSSGVKAITAADDTKAEDIFTPGQLKANPFLKGMTAKEIRAWSKGKVGGEDTAEVSDVPQIFSNAVADEVPSGEYFPSTVATDGVAVPPIQVPKEISSPYTDDGVRSLSMEEVNSGIPVPETTIEAGPETAVQTALDKYGYPINAHLTPEIQTDSVLDPDNDPYLDAEERMKQMHGGNSVGTGYQASTLRDKHAEYVKQEEAAGRPALGFKDWADANGMYGLQDKPTEESAADLEFGDAGSEPAAITDKQRAKYVEKQKQKLQEDIAKGDLSEEDIKKRQDAIERAEKGVSPNTVDGLVGGELKPEVAKQREDAANEIVKATQEQADAEGLTDEEFTNAIIDDMDNRAREAVTGQPELLDRTMSFFEEYGITDLFDKKEIGKMAMMYIGSRIMGYSHGGSLNFAMKNYATNVQAKQTAKAKEIKDLLEGGKFEPSSIAKYEKSGDINDLVKKGQTFTPTGNTKYVLYRDPKTKKTQRLKVREVKGSDDNGIYYQLPNGQRINDLSPNLRDYKPEMYEGTPEFNTYNQQAAASHLEALNAVVDVEDAKDDDGNLVVPIHPRLAAEAGVNWARAMGLDPKDSRVQAVIRDAYTAALRENKGKELQATELEPYLTRMSIMQEEQRPQLYERMDSDGKPTGKYISPVDLASIRAMVKEETSEIMKRRSTSVTTKQIWDYAAAQWESLGPEGQEKYHKAALDGDSSGFAKYLEEQLNANKYDRIVGQSK